MSRSTQGQDPRQLFQEAQEAHERGDAALAVSKYQEVLRLLPDFTAAHANLADALVSLGRFDEAIAEDRIALQEVPGNRQLELNLALAYFKKGDAAGAASLLGSLHDAEPGDARIAILLGECFVRQGRDAPAVSILAPLEKTNPGNLDLEWALGSALIGAGSLSDGVTRVQEVAEQRHSAEAYRLAAEAYFKLHEPDRARRDLDEARRLNPKLTGLDALNSVAGSERGSEPADVQIALLLGEHEVEQGHDAQAISILAPLEKTYSGDLDLEWALGSALIGGGRLRDGVERVQKAAEQGRSAKAYMLAAETYLKLDEFDQARRDAKAATRLNPSLPGLDTVNGMVLDYFGDARGAEAAFERALKSNPDDFQAELRLAAVEYSQRQLDAARQHLARALELEPSSAPAHYELGRAERAAGQLQAAVKDLEAAERENPGWLAPHVELTALYYRLKRPDDGAREKKIVDQMRAKAQQRGAESHVISPGAPAQ